VIFPKASPQLIADKVIANLDRDFGRIALPRYWAILTFVVCLIPWAIYRRLRF
jgi:hypothetical protein